MNNLSAIGINNKATLTGLAPGSILTIDECANMFSIVTTLYNSSKWLRGDLLVYAQDNFGDNWAQIVAETTTYSIGSVRNEMSVCRNVPYENRFLPDELSFSHHAEVTKIQTHLQRAYLEYALGNGLTRDQFRDYIKGNSLQDGYKVIALPPNTYEPREFKHLFERVLVFVPKEEKELIEKCKEILESL